MEKDSYTEMFQQAKQKSRKQGRQLVDSIRQMLIKKNVDEKIQNRILYSPFSEPKR